MDLIKKIITKEELAALSFFLPGLTHEEILKAIGCTIEASPAAISPAENQADRPFITDERLVVKTQASPLANIAIGALVCAPGEVNELSVVKTTWFLLTRVRAINSGNTVGFQVVSGCRPPLEEYPCKDAKCISVVEAFEILKPFQGDKDMVSVAETALDCYKSVQRNKRNIPTGESKPAGTKEMPTGFSNDGEFESLFFNNQVILAKESNSGRWIVTNYYGFSGGRFHVTNGIKVTAIAIFDPSMIGHRADLPKGFRYWQLCGQCLTSWRQG